MDFGGYMRVSRKGDRDPDQWLTVPAQRTAITGWIDGHGHRLADLREDVDVSGALDDRPNLEDLVAQVERGELAGLVVAKVDRFSRDLAYGAMVARRIERAGGTFVAADDGVVIGPHGRDFGGNDTAHFLFAQLLSMADFFRRRTVRGWHQVLDRHVFERGRHWGYAPPFGYRLADDGRLEPDPATAPLVVGAFERRAVGEGCSSIARWLDEHGARTARGGVPTHRWVRDMLRNRVYLGEARAGASRVAQGAHEALVEEGLFALVQQQGRVQRPRPVRDDRDAPVLTGLVRCWACRTVMTGAYAPYQGERRRVYRCRGRHAHGDCPDPATAAEPELLALVEPIFWRVLADDAQATALRDDVGEGGRLQDDVDAAVRALEAYLAADFTGVDARLVAQGARGHQQRLDDARARLSDWRRGSDRQDVDVDGLRAAWAYLEPVARGALLADVIGAIVVRAPRVRRRGRSHPLGGRAAVLLVDDLPVDLPRQGRRVRGVASFPPLDDEAVAWVPLGE